jgi:hypothetical protein
MRRVKHGSQRNHGARLFVHDLVLHVLSQKQSAGE